MATSKLLDYDHDLCDYILGQVRSHLRSLRVKPKRHVELDYDRFHQLDMPEWLGCVVARLPTSLADHLWAGVVGEPIPRSLDDGELNALEAFVADPPLSCEDEAVWLPYPAIHCQWVELMPAIQRMLPRPVAEEWAENSAAFAARLSEEKVSLVEGITTVHEWLWCLRRFMKVLAELEPPISPNAQEQRLQRTELIPSVKEDTRHIQTLSSPVVLNEAPVCDWREAMGLTGLKKTKLYELFHRGIIKGYRDGKMIRFYREDLTGYMRDRENRLAPPVRIRQRSRKPQPTSTNRFKFL
jgi:excisionase family DNA binding protein